MLLLALAADLADTAALLVPLVDQPGQDIKDEDVKAGWTAFAIFVLLGAAVAFLGWSLVRQLKKADASAQAGRYDPSDRPRRRTSLPRAGEEPQDPGAR